MGHAARLFVLAAISTLAACSAGRGDLGTCIVLHGGDIPLGGDASKKVSAAIYKAYEQSDDSDGQMVFILTVWKSDTKGGSYSIRKASLALGEGRSYTLSGYEVTAAHEEGIRNAVAEIEKAFKAGRIYQLKPGKREGPVETPRYVRP